MPEELTEEKLAEWEHALHEDGAMECETGRTLQLIASVRTLRHGLIEQGAEVNRLREENEHLRREYETRGVALEAALLQRDRLGDEVHHLRQQRHRPRGQS